MHTHITAHLSVLIVSKRQGLSWQRMTSLSLASSPFYQQTRLWHHNDKSFLICYFCQLQVPVDHRYVYVSSDDWILMKLDKPNLKKLEHEQLAATGNFHVLVVAVALLVTCNWLLHIDLFHISMVGEYDLVFGKQLPIHGRKSNALSWSTMTIIALLTIWTPCTSQIQSEAAAAG